MESVLGRYRNLIILVLVLFLQVLGLAVQVKRSAENESTRLIRIWTVDTVTPFEKILVRIQTSTSGIWHNYFYLRGVRAENRQLKAEIERLRLQQVRLSEDAEQARRLQALLGFKEQFISQTMAAQVIGSSGSAQSRSIYIDKGARDGVKTDMAVITADGVVGKVLHVYHSTSQVLLIDDQSSGVGALLEKSRLQGVVRGTPAGEVMLEKVMSDQQVQAGEAVLTSGGDRIFPKGLAVGTVSKISQGPDLFLNIRVKPATDLNKLEEVLVVTKIEEKEIAPSQSGPIRAAEILAQRLPSVPDKPPAENAKTDKNVSKAPAGIAAQTNSQAGVATTTNPQQITISPKLPGSTPSATGKPAQIGAAPTSNVGTPAMGVSDAVSPSAAAATPATVKPATAQKPLPPIVKLSDKGSKPAAPGKPRLEPTSSDQNKPDQAQPVQAKPDPPTPNQTQPVSPKPDQPGVDQSKPDQPPPQSRPR
jgi:rod shape-determining protein MreC